VSISNCDKHDVIDAIRVRWLVTIDLLSHFEVAMSAGALRMHHALRNALAVEVGILLE
jgi:hypothetical protein